jgi:hypothetical protein
MWKWLSRFVRLGKRVEGAVDVGSEAYDVLESYAALLKEEARWGSVPRALKDKARKEMAEFTHRMGSKIDSFPET